jgi:DNA polymerase III gamma/tau subunit
MRDAESTLDQLISFCGEKIEEADVLSMFGLAAQSQILNLSRAILAGEIQTALTQLNELSQNGKDLGRLLSDLLNHFRNLLIFQISRGDLKLLEVSENEIASLKEQSVLADANLFTRILETLADAELRLRDAASKKILLEVTLLRAIEARNSLPIDAVLRQLNQLRGGQNISAPASPTTSAPAQNLFSPKAVSAPKIETPPTLAPPVASENLAELWLRLIEAVGRASPFTRGYLMDAHPVSFEKNILVIGFDPEFEDHLGLVDNARNHALLQTKLGELGHANSMVKFIKAEMPIGEKIKPPVSVSSTVASPATETKIAPPIAKEKTAAVPFNKNDFKNDPLIQKALEIFKGQIVEVRS